MITHHAFPKWITWQIFAFCTTFSLFLLICNLCFAQQSFTAGQINRLSDAGKVYGYIKYFHPYLQYKTLNWDSVFAANVEPILNAKNKKEYASAMRQLLTPLNDDLTVVADTYKDKNYRLQPTAYNVQDSILYISMNDVTDESSDKVQEAFSRINQVKAVIFDMRKPVNSHCSYGAAPGTVLDWSSGALFKGDLMMPSFRSITYDALPNEKFDNLLGANFKQSTLFTGHGSAPLNLPIAFIVTQADQVPLFAMALQRKGKAAIINGPGKELVIGNTTSFYIADSVLVKMRLSEGINADGSLAVVRPNATYSSAFADEALIRAKEVILKGIKRDSVSAQSAPLLVYQPSLYADKGNYPSLGYRVLAAAKIFSTIDHFHPDLALMDRNWEDSYRSTLIKFVEAKDSLEYMQAVAELYANIQDSHGFISLSTDRFSLRLNPVIQGRGNYVPPVTTRVVEGKVVVNGIYNDTVCQKIGLQLGDVILLVNGKDPLKMIEEARKYQPASTKVNQTFFLCNFILFGNKGELKRLKVQKANGTIKEVDMPTLTKFDGGWNNDPYVLKIMARHMQPTFKRLPKNIGYADLTSPLQQRDFDSLFTEFNETKAIIFDLRGYRHFDGNPFKTIMRNHHVFDARLRLVKPSSPNIKDDSRDIASTHDEEIAYQSAETWAGNEAAVRMYKGKIIVLMNESNQSAAEHTCLVFKAVCNATLVGSPTSGTNGGLDEFDIPGNLVLWFSNAEVSWPDGTRTQRVGIKPDITVYPTIKGIQAGKDEVLDRAMEFVTTGK